MAQHNQKYREYAYNGACQICGFDRYVEVCHLIPKRIGGGHSGDNILLLCPNHHKILDYGLLNREEIAYLEKMIYDAIDKHKENLKIQEYLYFLLRLKQNPPKWLQYGNIWKARKSNAY